MKNENYDNKKQSNLELKERVDQLERSIDRIGRKKIELTLTNGSKQGQNKSI